MFAPHDPQRAGTEQDENRLIGTVIAHRYRITGVLGTGAMGAVYRADDLERGVPIAIKVLRKHLVASDEAAARFRREGLVGGKVEHPNCVAVFDFGSAEKGSFYMAMELLEGQSLGTIIDREGPLSWQRALHIARHVLRGLAHAHDESIVHRDIKPDNIFVSRCGDDPDYAKILDFGIAKLVGDTGANAITQAGITIGTPTYLSPEQATGGVLDGRSDLYSLSIVLYEMLTGRTPFAGREPLKTLLAHATEPVPWIAEVAPRVDVPREVEQLVRDGLEKRPDERIGSAAEYIVRIEGLLGVSAALDVVELHDESDVRDEAEPPRRRPVAEAPRSRAVAERPRAVAEPPRKRRRRRGALLALGAAAILAIAGAVIAMQLLARDRAAPPPTPAAMQTQAVPMSPEVTAALDALARGKTCAARRAAVKKLRTLGDARAVPALEKARSRPRRGKNTNACLRADADAAIAELSHKTPPG